MTADAPINRRSRRLVVLVATYNRLESLRRTLDSVADGTKGEHEVVVIDGGSTDGTIEFLRGRPDLTAELQGKLLGTARAYNAAWRRVDSAWTVWLSDDTTVTPGALDLAVQLLETHPRLGMVGLKMKDTLGPWTDEPYLGGVCPLGVLNCNHGVLPTPLLRAIGYFNEGYRSYTIDLDLTASVLAAGRSVAMTRAIGVMHHREGADNGMEFKMRAEMAGIDNMRLYKAKFGFLAGADTPAARLRSRVSDWLGRRLFGRRPDRLFLGLNRRDWRNLGHARFVAATDPLDTAGLPYHLVQSVPDALLERPDNPYRELAARA
jgi:GT2 family glycosyltransferase